jgi:capsular polysaccharide biosynthesis protein
MTFKSTLRRGLQGLVDRRVLSAALVGHRLVRSEELQTYASRVAAAGHAEIILARRERRDALPLPLNRSSQAELSAVEVNGRSFRGVQAAREASVGVFAVRDATVIGSLDHNGNETYSIHAGGAWLGIAATDLRPEHRPLLRKRPSRRIAEGTWVIGHWYGNYYHWLVDFLPRVMLLEEAGRAANLLWPRPEKLAAPGFIRESIERLGYDPDRSLSIDIGITEVGQLTIPKTPAHWGPGLALVAQRLTAGRKPMADAPRRIFISRRKASVRRVANEGAVQSVLARYGITELSTETLDFAAQINVMQRAEMIVGLHGAGLTNMLFAPRGAAVVEIGNFAQFPNADYYAVASACGHAYWMVDARSVGEGRLDRRDLEVDIDCLERTLEAAGQMISIR